MDEEGDAERAAQWDLAAADTAYKAQVEAAMEQQRAAEEEQRLLIEQLEVCQPYSSSALCEVRDLHLDAPCCKELVRKHDQPLEKLEHQYLCQQAS